ncbi:hypothetical protein N4R57_21475 [Rhodobacteraceae bacterium D3-12]|nr:hypothetical protein N4R57_21475 [Rhodobacteraceae bacterium D3-12]
MTLRWPDLALALLFALLVAALSWLGVSKALGAHPWWAAQSGLIGAALGFGVFLVARLFGTSNTMLALVAAFTLLFAMIAAYFGKSAFVNAEDFNATAGRIWYFGWISIWSAVTLLLSAVTARRLKGLCHDCNHPPRRLHRTRDRQTLR